MRPPPGRILVHGTILLTTICSLLTGCSKAGPTLVDVSGQVTLDGSPLTEGTVSFISSTGKIASARIDAGGGFQNYPDDYQVIEELHRRGEMTVRLAYNLFTQKPTKEKQDFPRSL